MAKVKVKVNESVIRSEIVEQITKAIDDNSLKREVGEFASDRIRFQARIAEPLNDRGSFPDLKDSTIRRRVQLESLNNTAITYDAARSNLTFTGQFLDSIDYRFVPGGVEIYFKGSRRPIVTKNGVSQDNPTNAELAIRLEKLGFVVFTKKGLEGNDLFNRQIRQIVRRFLRRRLK